MRAVGAVGSVRSRRDSAEGATTVHRNRRVVRCLQQALPKAEGRRPKAAKGDEGRRRATKGVLVRFRSSSCLRSAAVLPLLCHISATFLPLCPPRFRRYSTVIPPLSPHSAGVCHCSAGIQPILSYSAGRLPLFHPLLPPFKPVQPYSAAFQPVSAILQPSSPTVLPLVHPILPLVHRILSVFNLVLPLFNPILPLSVTLSALAVVAASAAAKEKTRNVRDGGGRPRRSPNNEGFYRGERCLLDVWEDEAEGRQLWGRGWCVFRRREVAEGAARRRPVAAGRRFGTSGDGTEREMRHG